MFFDDVGLMNPNQVARLSQLVDKHNYIEHLNENFEAFSYK